MHQLLQECAGLSADRHGSERENRQENEKTESTNPMSFLNSCSREQRGITTTLFMKVVFLDPISIFKLIWDRHIVLLLASVL